MQNQRHKARGSLLRTDLSRKPRLLPVIMKRSNSPYCLSVHHTAYYFTDGGEESQANLHKNIKIGRWYFGDENQKI